MSTISTLANFCFIFLLKFFFESIEVFLGILPYVSCREDHEYLPTWYSSVFPEVFHTGPFLSLNSMC